MEQRVAIAPANLNYCIMKFNLKSLVIPAVLFTIALFSFSCAKDAVLQENIVGEWHYSDNDTDVYIAFGESSEYELFQKIGAGRYREYRGKWFLEKGILSGDYAERSGWGSSCKVEVNSNTLTLIALNGSEEVTVYTRESIPASVRESANMIQFHLQEPRSASLTDF